VNIGDNTALNEGLITGFVCKVNFAFQVSRLFSDIADQIDGKAVGVTQQSLIITIYDPDQHRTNSTPEQPNGARSI